MVRELTYVGCRRREQELAAGADDSHAGAPRAGLFLQHGLGGASINQFARLAHADKPTVYARFPHQGSIVRSGRDRNAAEVGADSKDPAPRGRVA